MASSPRVRSTFLYADRSEELFTIVFSELASFVTVYKEPEWLKHLKEYWYFPESWSLCGRRDDEELLFSRTIMKFQAHWSLLKGLNVQLYTPTTEAFSSHPTQHSSDQM